MGLNKNQQLFAGPRVAPNKFHLIIHASAFMTGNVHFSREALALDGCVSSSSSFKNKHLPHVFINKAHSLWLLPLGEPVWLWVVLV